MTNTDGWDIQYTNWVDNYPPENCISEECDDCNTCAFIDVQSQMDVNWKTGNCFDLESFGCEVDVGTHLHEGFTENIILNIYLTPRGSWRILAFQKKLCATG